jgi:regulator of sigma E protease
MNTFLRDLVSVAFVLGIMIFVHEWGHFIAAKLCGVRVEVFSFGLGPRLFGLKRGDTDYRLSALPFGGYVRMAGDNVVEERTGADYEYLSRPRWQRVLIAIAGPTMNILLAFFIFWGIYWFVGIPYEMELRQPADVVAVPQNSATATGVQPGDRILEVNGVKTPTWDTVFLQVGKVKPGDSLSLTVLRGGSPQKLEIRVPEKPESVDSLVGYPRLPAVVEDVEIGFPAEKSGLRSGDKIAAIEGKPVATWYQLVEAVHQSGGRAIQFTVLRDGREIPLSIVPIRGMSGDGRTVWQIGVSSRTHEGFEREGSVTAFKDATIETYLNMRQIIQVIGGLFTGRVSIRELAGPLGIARVSGQAAQRGPMTLLGLMAVISLNLGLLNLLPIPILDGGHVLLLVIEGTIRRDLSIAVKERFVQVGLVFLLGIFAFVMYSDILKMIQNH